MIVERHCIRMMLQNLGPTARVGNCIEASMVEVENWS